MHLFLERFASANILPEKEKKKISIHLHQQPGVVGQINRTKSYREQQMAK